MTMKPEPANARPPTKAPTEQEREADRGRHLHQLDGRRGEPSREHDVQELERTQAGCRPVGAENRAPDGVGVPAEEVAVAQLLGECRPEGIAGIDRVADRAVVGDVLARQIRDGAPRVGAGQHVGG
jgi:hypothetical protein